MAKMWAVVDLDGTISNCDHRVHLARTGQWDQFHMAAGHDTPHTAEVMLVQAWANAGGKVCYSTGRTEPYRTLTKLWLKQHGLPIGPLIMRGVDDRRPSTVTKLENLRQLEQEILMPGDQVCFILEDQDKLVALWRELGYTCLQPRPGAF